MKIEKIITDYLNNNNYQGLLNIDGECGCTIKDLAPCENISLDCEPGYLLECSRCEKMETCHMHGCGSEWCVSTDKQKENNK
jgi:hypothetical protein